MYLALVLVAAITIGVVVAFVHGNSRLGRWGTRRGKPVEVGASPYREGKSSPVLANGAPTGLRFVAGLNTFWGVITGLIFVPAGAVLVLFGAPQLKIISFPVGFVVLSGLGLAFSLGIASARVLRREQLPQVRKVLTWSMCHHAAVLAVMGLASLMINEAFLIAASAIPCVLGMTFAHLLIQGVNQIEYGLYSPSTADGYS